jgi:hypothetical protein
LGGKVDFFPDVESVALYVFRSCAVNVQVVDVTDVTDQELKTFLGQNLYKHHDEAMEVIAKKKVVMAHRVQQIQHDKIVI